MRVLYFLIAILLGVNYVFVNFRIGPLTIDRLLEFALFFFFFKDFIKDYNTNKFLKGWVNFILAFGLLQMLVNIGLVIRGTLPLMDVIAYFIKALSFIVFSYLFFYILKQGKIYIDALLGVHFLIVIFAILLHPLSPIALDLFEIKAKLFPVLDKELALRLGGEKEYITGGYAGRFRVSGPFPTAILFSYFAISNFLLNFYMYVKHKGKFYLFNIAIIIIASILTQTRSLVLGEFLAIGAYLFFYPGSKRKIIHFKGAIAISLGILLLIGYKASKFDYDPTGDTSGSRLTSVSSGGERDSRPLLWYTGLYTAVVNPLGISSQDYWDVKWDFYYEYGHYHILFYPSHNGLINIAFQYSFFGYILFAFFVWFLIRYIKQLDQKYQIFYLISFLGYAFHIFFHNDFILDDDYLFLLVLITIGYEWERKQNENLEIEVKDENLTLENA